MKYTRDVYCMFVVKMFEGTHTHTHSVVSWGLCFDLVMWFSCGITATGSNNLTNTNIRIGQTNI